MTKVTIEGMESGYLDDMLEVEVRRLVAERIGKAVDDAIKGEVEAQIREVTREHVEPLVSKVLEDGWQETDTWGDPKGKPFKASKLVRDLLTRKDRNSSWSTSWAEDMIREIMKKDLKKDIDEVRAQIRKSIDSEVGALLQQSMKNALGLK